MIIKAEFKGKLIEIEIPVPEYWLKRADKRKSKYWRDADNLDKRIKKEYIKAYKELEKQLYTFAGKYGTDNVLKYSEKRVTALMLEIKPHINDLYEFQQTTLTDHLLSVYEANYYAGLYDLFKGTHVAYSFVGLNERAVKKAIAFPWSGASFSDRIYANKNKLIQTLRTEITQSLIRGEGIRQTAAVVSKRLDISYKNAERLIQTETGAVLTESDKEFYSDFGQDKYQYDATLDNRTSETCRELDQTVYNVEDMVIGVNAPPMHPRCRSTTVPWFDDDDGTRIARDIKTGKCEYVPGNLSYNEWYSKYVD